MTDYEVIYLIFFIITQTAILIVDIISLIIGKKKSYTSRKD